MNMNTNSNTSIKNEGLTSDLFNGLNFNLNMNNNVNEQNDNGDEMGEYTGFQLMDDDNLSLIHI